MDVTPHELRTTELREAWRGYRQDDVDHLLERVAATIERLQAQVQRLSDRLAEAEHEAGAGREADEMLRRTLLLAQRTADAAVAEAQERARRVLSESEAHAHSIVSGAEEEARRVAIAERHRVESEIRDLSTRRDVLLADVEALEQAARDHRRRMREFLEIEMARVDARVLPEVPDVHTEPPPPLAPATDPPGAHVDLAAEEHRGPETVHEAAPETAGGRDGPDANVPDSDDPDSDDPGWGPVGAGPGADDVDILPERRRRWRLRDAEPDPAPPDDAFFDELRRAVTDETPLGPRDDESDGPHAAGEPVPQGSAPFFDQDDSGGG